MKNRVFIKSTKVGIIVIITFFALLFSIDTLTKDNEFGEKRVLFISSYSSAFETFYQQIDGINDTFEGYPITVDMEFMDSKRFYTEENVTNFLNNLKYKTNLVEYDAVMVSDDNGLIFTMEHKDELFPEVPIVFFGVNNRENAEIYGANINVTGVVENISIEDTIRVALDMNPNASKVVALTDATPTGKADYEQFLKLEDSFLDYEFSSIDMNLLPLDDFLYQLSLIEDDSVIVLLAALRDVNGFTLSFDESLELILASTKLPIYHLYEHGVGDGLIGGKVVSHYVQGQFAAEIVLDYFLGTDFSELHLVEQSPNVYVFDYILLQEFGYDEMSLPDGTILVNKDLTFFEEYQTLIFFYVIVLILAAVTIGVLVWALIQRSKGRLQLLESKTQLELAYKNLENLNEELLYSSFHDYLTGLYNRNYFEQELPKINKTNNLPVSIILADVNGLKLLNDAFGHLVGDVALINTAKILINVFSGYTIARIGGDEFAVIGYELDELSAMEKMKQVREEASKITVEGVKLSLSIGYAVKEDRDKNYNELFTEAEDWMYREKLSQVPSNRSAIIDTIVATINQKDEYSEVHSRRVAEISAKIAELMGLNTQYVNEVRTAGLLHDIGKIIVPTEILNKTGRLTESEFSEIKKHSEIGYRILNSVSSMREIAEYVFCHHERIDGLGYPRGLTGENIPIQSKIISIADAMDAMLSNRLYRKKISREACYYELKKNAGTQFCPEVIKVVLPNFNELYELIMNH